MTEAAEGSASSEVSVTSTPSEAPNITAEQSFSQRMDALESQFHEESLEERKNEAVEEPASEEEAPKAPKPKVIENEKPSLKEKLEAIAAKERERAEKRQKEQASSRALKEAEEYRSKVEELNARLAELEPLAKAWDDPEARRKFFTERENPNEVANWFVDQTKPEVIAELKAKGIKSEVMSEVEKLRQELQEIKQEKQREAVRSQQTEAYNAFKNLAREHAEDAPLVARGLENNPDFVLTLADRLADDCTREGKAWTGETILAELEKTLGELVGAFSERRDAQEHPATPSHISAGAKAKLLSNRAASTRVSIAEPPDESLPFNQRLAQLEAQYRKGA